jgi:hypothetical protein
VGKVVAQAANEPFRRLQSELAEALLRNHKLPHCVTVWFVKLANC